MTESVTARLSGSDIKAIDSLIKAGLYTTRSDFLRAAARNLLREDAPIIPELFVEMQRKAMKKGLTKDKMLKDIRKDRNDSFIE